MNENLQENKKYFKFNFIKNLLNHLSEYNNINGYNNQKKFTFIIEQREAKEKDKKIYEIKVLRGLNSPQEIFIIRILTEKNDNKSIINFINEIINSNYFYYTTFNSDYSKYNINLKNDILIEFKLKTEDDINNCKLIEESFKNKTIINNKQNNKVQKDEVQEQKAKSIIETFNTLLYLISEYNNQANYINTKPFKFNISNYYDKEKNCYIYSFKIKRGNIKETTILNLRASIKNNDVIYNKLYDLILNTKKSNHYCYQAFNYKTYKPYYYIKLDNNIELKFDIITEQDKIFYKNFDETTSYDLDKNKNDNYILKK